MKRSDPDKRTSVQARFIAHPDPRRLIEWLREDLYSRLGSGSLRRACVLVPNKRLSSAVRRRLGEGGGVFLGLRVIDLWALVTELAEQVSSEARCPHLAPAALLRQEVHDSLRREGGSLAGVAERTPGLTNALLATFGDLREAEVGDEDVGRLLADPASQPICETLQIYRRYLSALHELARSGWLDRAGYVRRALPRAGAWAERMEAVYLYGAYELIGVHRSLLHLLAGSTSVHVLLPLEVGGPAWSYGVKFASEFLCGEGEAIERLEGPPAGVGARAAVSLYDEVAEPDPQLSDETFELFHTQGIEAELTAVARRILRLHQQGVPLREIGVVGRSLSPYVPHLARVLDSHRIPFVTSAAQPLARFPAAGALRSLLSVLARDFERDDLLALLRSPLLQAPRGRQPRPDLLERWSAVAAVRKGLAAWIGDLPQWLSERLPRDAEQFFADPRERERFLSGQQRALADQVAILEGLGVEALEWRKCSSWVAQVEFVRGLVGRWLQGFEEGADHDAAATAILRVLGDLHDAASAARGAAKAGEILRFLEVLEGSLSGCDLPVRDEDRDGVRVLDGMQARGHAFRALFLIGFNAGAFPRKPADDPFLPELWRERLRRQHRRLVPLRDNLEEEHLLLALWISSAGDRIFVSYRRADENGRAEVPSFALRELARLRLGEADSELLQPKARLIPVHPRDRLLEWQKEPGLITPIESAHLVALQDGNRAARVRDHLERQGAANDAVKAALRWVQERGDRWAAHEGRCGPVPAAMLPGRWSPSSLQDMAYCPLKFFFKRVLGVEGVPEALQDGMFDPLDWGTRVHALLQDVFRTLGRESILEPGAGTLRPEEEQRCRNLVQGGWRDHFADLGERVSRSVHVLWEEHVRLWQQALADFVVRDLGSWRARCLDLIELESEGAVELGTRPGGDEPPLALSGRMDRIARDPQGGSVISDYKTGKKLDTQGVEKEMLRGSRLQAPLYTWIEQARGGRGGTPVAVEFLGVGPNYAEDDEGARIVLGTDVLDRLRPGIEETVRTLAGLASEGCFPFHDQHGCDSCEFESACHHRERPARRVVESGAGNADYFDTLKKDAGAPTLEQVRAEERKGSAKK